MYAGMSIMVPSAALLLGSWIGLAVALVIVVAGAFRAVMEERELEGALKAMRIIRHASATGSSRWFGDRPKGVLKRYTAGNARF